MGLTSIEPTLLPGPSNVSTREKSDDLDERGARGRYYTRPLDLLLMNHYPATKRSPAKGDFGLGAHCDYGFTTLLLTDGTPGLEVCKDKTKAVKEREWVSVPAQKKGTFVINFGDLVEILSNGKYASVLHRVVNTSGQERSQLCCTATPTLTPGSCPWWSQGKKRSTTMWNLMASTSTRSLTLYTMGCRSEVCVRHLG